MGYKENKSFRLLSMYERLNKGELISKTRLAREFNVTEKSVQRDIDDLRAYLADVHFSEIYAAIEYDKTEKGYRLVRNEREMLTNTEILAMCKILLESRALRRDELDRIISKLLGKLSPDDKCRVEEIIRDELYNYVPPRHGKKLLEPIWELSRAIRGHEIIEFSYIRQDGTEKARCVKPVAIMFSEFYFYLVAYLADGSKEYPTVFRIDRMKNVKRTKEHFSIPYKERFNDGEFRKRVQFMYSGELNRVTFEYSGQNVESVLDRLPTAEILSSDNGIYKIRAEVYGEGIYMWLRSQGDNVKVVE